MADNCSEWIRDFRKMCPVDAVKFEDVWKHYDSDGNGYIDGDEIDSFFDDLLKMSKQKLSLQEKNKLKDQFMKEFDENRDGRIEMSELALILPPEDSFLILFHADHGEHLTGAQFMTVWRQFSSKKKDYIESTEIKQFLAKLFKQIGREVSASQLEKYSSSLLRIYDANNDGKLSFKELSRILPPSENILLRFKDQMNLTSENFEQLFSHYDSDGNGSISGEELDVFLYDVAKAISCDIVSDKESYGKFKKMMLFSCDSSGDGCLQKDEVALWLGID